MVYLNLIKYRFLIKVTQHQIFHVYIFFEVEEGVVKCGCSKKAENRRHQLYDIQKHRGLEIGGRFAILPVNERCVIRSERLFFSKLKNRLPDTEIFNITFETALRILREINVPENYNIFYLTSEEKEKISNKEKLANEWLENWKKNWDASLRTENDFKRIGTIEYQYIKTVEEFRDYFLAIAERVSTQIITRLWSEYRFILKTTKEIISPYLWDMGLAKSNIKDEDGKILNIIPDYIDENNALIISSLKTQLDLVLDFLEININDIHKGDFELARFLFRSETIFASSLVKTVRFYSEFDENSSEQLLKAKGRIEESASLIIRYLFERTLITFFSVFEDKDEKIEQYIKNAKSRIRVLGKSLNDTLKREREDNKLIINMRIADLDINYTYGLISV